jgi:hypothetical protein
VYGSLKNYWSGKSGEQVPCPSFESDDSSSSSRTTATPSPLGSALNSSKANLGSQTDNHPGDDTDLCAEKKVQLLPEQCSSEICFSASIYSFC